MLTLKLVTPSPSAVHTGCFFVQENYQQFSLNTQYVTAKPCIYIIYSVLAFDF